MKQAADYSVYGGSDTLISDRRSRRRQDRLYPRLGYDAGAHRWQRGDQVGEGHRNLPPAGGLGFPRRAAADFGGGFSGEDAALRRGRALLEVLAAASWRFGGDGLAGDVEGSQRKGYLGEGLGQLGGV